MTIGIVTFTRPQFWLALAVPALLTSACAGESGNEQQVVANAIAADEQLLQAADDRADHLDELSAELSGEANVAAPAQRQALQNESAADLKAAATIRAGGESQGAAREEQIERNAGVLNAQK